MIKTKTESEAAGSHQGNEPHKMSHIRDKRIERVVPLTAPNALLDELPLTPAHAEVVLQGRRDIHSILEGTDDRLLVVVGPCSVHDVAATLDYAGRLRDAADSLPISGRDQAQGASAADAAQPSHVPKPT